MAVSTRPEYHLIDLKTVRVQSAPSPKQRELGHLYATGIAYGPGEGLVQDGVEAYKWCTIVIASERTRPEWRAWAGRGRERVATRMTADEIGEAERLAAEWLAASLEPHR